MNKMNLFQFQTQGNPNPNSNYSSVEIGAGPYHDWELFAADYRDMLQNLKIFVYFDVSMSDESSPFARIFLPLPDPFLTTHILPMLTHQKKKLHNQQLTIPAWQGAHVQHTSAPPSRFF
ncbi:unnamed protein product [Fraxinus pennsylvanica]|uniref:Uncharacterized protein n=1 Tax=Fraxinus pennsylvanica TaxID=56036 RepID=A0AAD1Z9R6_9LAMI|nr:unnamed protein product [Fraxinus pennsylvanica]